MDRYFVRTAAVVFCAAWAAGCGTTGHDKPSAPVAAAAPATSPTGSATAADDLPATLDGEIARAHTLRVAGSYDEAARALAQLMIVAPDDVRVVGEYGKALAQQGRPGEALPFLNRAIQLDANDWTLYSALGVAYDQVDQHAKARVAYEHALSLKPGQPDVLNNYAVSQMLAGNTGDARKLLAQASANGASDAKVQNNLALLATMKHPVTPSVSASVLPAPRSQRAPIAVATADPKTLPGVMMQTVPVDPQAGPVATARAATAHHTARRKLAAHKPKSTAPTTLRGQDTASAAGSQPILRTAADGQ